MNNLISLVMRDIKIFYRTKGNIFFSMLSVIILVVLHFAIFQNTTTDAWAAGMQYVPIIQREHLLWLADSLMFSAIIPIGSVTISLTTLGLMVSDREKNTLSDFLVSPIGRNSLMASYLISSFIVGFIMLLGFIMFFQFYFLIMYGIGFSLSQLSMILLVTVGALIFGNIFILLLISFFKTQQALSAVGAIVGVTMGFISGAYIPIGLFGETTANIFSALPFAQIAVLSRIAFMHRLEYVTPLTHEMLSGEIARTFGFELWIGNHHIPTMGILLIASGTTALLLVLLIIIFAKMKKAD